MHSFAPLQSQQFSKFLSNVLLFLDRTFRKHLELLINFAVFEQILMIFVRNCLKFREILYNVILLVDSFLLYIGKIWYIGSIWYIEKNISVILLTCTATGFLLFSRRGQRVPPQRRRPAAGPDALRAPGTLPGRRRSRGAGRRPGDLEPGARIRTILNNIE